jgi:hypothetical protein
VEYAQNFPVLLGLMLAVQSPELWQKIAWTVAGAFGTAVCIAQTERIKLALPPDHREAPRDMAFNTAAFACGALIYLGYAALRTMIATPLLLDVVVGAAIGVSAGTVQMFFVDSRRVTAQSIGHTLALTLTGAVTLVLFGIVGAWTPIVAALLLCLVMTLIIVRIDYWALLSSPSAAQP